MAIKGGKPYLAYTPLSHYIFCPVVKVVSTQFPPCVPAEIALISTLTRQVCTYQRLTYLLTLSTYRCADLTSSSSPESVTAYSSMPTSFAAAVAGTTVYGYLNADNGYAFYRMDLESMEPEILSNSSAPVLMTERAYDYSTGTMYAIGVNTSNGQSIYTIDLNTGGYSEVVNITCFETIQAFAVATDGTAYGITYGDDAHLVEINLEDGTTRDIGSTGQSAFYVQSMTYDHENGRLFWAQYKDAAVNCLYEIDIESAETYACGMIGNRVELCGMFIPYKAQYQNGDVDMDGRVTVADAVMTLRHAMGIIELSGQSLVLADIDGDNTVNVADAVAIMRIAMGLQ